MFRVPLVFLLILLGLNVVCGAGNVSLGGYFKSYLLLLRQPPLVAGGRGVGQRPVLARATNRLRLHLSYAPQRWAILDAAYDIVPGIQSPSLAGSPLFFGNIDPVSYRVIDPKIQLYPPASEPVRYFSLNQNLDRASVTFRTPHADIIAGRQAIAWGSARVINPTDVLAPFTFDTLDTEDRIGVDALRVRIPLGVLSEIDAGYVSGKNLRLSESACYSRVKFNLRKTDVSLLLMGFRRHLLTGLDLARSIGGAGVWFETAYVFVEVMRNLPGEQNGYLRASTGLDYSFTGKTYAFVEYHFNGAGSGSREAYPGTIGTPAYTDGSVYLLGRHYLAPGVTYQLSPLLSLTAQALFNLTDPSLFFTPQMEYNVASNFYLGVGAHVGLGKSPALVAGSGSTTLRSEFGAYPDVLFGSFRWYF